MNQSKLWPIKKVDKRSQGKFILITTINNLSIRHNPLRPDLKHFQSTYVYDQINTYYRERLEYKEIPFHYYLNMIKSDWNIFTTTSLDYRSDFLKHSVDMGYLPFWFRDAIIIVVQDNYKVKIPDTRMYDVLANKLLQNLLNTQKIGKLIDSVFWLDEVFDFDKLDEDKRIYGLDHNYKYDVSKSLYFDRLMFNLSCKRFL